MTAELREDALTFDCDGETLVGILHRPAEDAPARHASLGLVIIVGGPQYRAGSHRQFVQLARALAAHGHPVLRFDVRGMGDSSGALQAFETISLDIGSAIDALQRVAPGVKRVALWGLCDGASAALLYLAKTSDARVVGLGLANPWVRSDASLARTHVKHYYIDRLRQKQFWIKLARGHLTSRVIRDLWDNLRAGWAGPPKVREDADLPYQTRMLDAWKRFRGGVLLVLSGQDYTAKEFIEFASAETSWQPLLRQQNLQVRELTSADHTFSSASDCRHLERAVCGWLSERVVGHEDNATARLPSRSRI